MFGKMFRKKSETQKKTSGTTSPKKGILKLPSQRSPSVPISNAGPVGRSVKLETPSESFSDTQSGSLSPQSLPDSLKLSYAKFIPQAAESPIAKKILNGDFKGATQHLIGYIGDHSNILENWQIRNLNFYLGQCYLLEDMVAPARDYLKTALIEKPRSPGEICHNAYIHALMSMAMFDKDAVGKYRKEIGNRAPPPEKCIQANIAELDCFLKDPKLNFVDVYFKSRKIEHPKPQTNVRGPGARH